jgi:predicted polyphosphate/ATP-dependent NAD kinase
LNVRIGFLVNPVAGMGGSVGLKGTDGESIQKEALRRKAEKVSPPRAVRALSSLKGSAIALEILTCEGEMGAEELTETGLPHKVVYRPRQKTTRDDTIEAARAFLGEDVALIVFVGGDGTARDVLRVADELVPILGVPSGVKMHSAVFLNRPDDLGPVLSAFVEDGATKSADVMDIDEDLFRKGRVSARLYGIAKIPDEAQHMQSSKMAYASGSAEDEASEIGQYIADTMEPGVLYVLGPGSTTEHIARAIGVKKSLLGVDVVLDRRVLVSDASEQDLIRALRDGRKARIVVSPIGSQGFFLGRGNQQISPEVVKTVGTGNIMVVSTPTKLRDTPALKVDSGDAAIDRKLKGRIKVITGYRRRRLVEVL